MLTHEAFYPSACGVRCRRVLTCGHEVNGFGRDADDARSLALAAEHKHRCPSPTRRIRYSRRDLRRQETR